MKHLTSAVAAPLVGALAGWLLLAVPAAQAQPATPAAAEPDIVVVYTDADAKAVLNARIAALKTVLELTPEQDKLWGPVEASIRKIAADSMARGKARSEAQPPADVFDVLGRIADAEATRAAGLKAFVEAARPLFTSLTDAQKARIPAFLGMAGSADSPLSTRSLWLFEEEER